MKGRTTSATNRSFENSLAYLHGRIEHEIETFADRLSVSPLELAARLAELLSGAGQWTGHQLPGVPLAAGGRWSGDSSSPALEGVIESHGSEASHQTGAQTGALSKKSKKISAAQKALWSKLTPRQRSQKTLARYEAVKHPTPAQKKAMATLRAKLAGKLPRERNVDMAKQRIYLARAHAKKLGLPLPPLPKEMTGESKEERRRRLDREAKQARRDAQKRAAGQYKAKSQMARAAQSAWSGMTAAQRQAEMKRRRQVAQKNKAKKASGESSVVWNKPGKKNSQQTYVDAGAQVEARPETEAATGT